MREKPFILSKRISIDNDDRHASAFTVVRTALETLRFGQIVLTVHDGKVVQLDVTEKQRFS